MTMPDDQPRPDLDAAIDAVLPSLTAVSDEAAAASLRRTRLALAAPSAPRRASAWGWGFAATATAGVIVLVTVALWRRPTSAPDTLVARRPASPAVVASPPAPAAPRVERVPVAPEHVASAGPAAPRPNRGRTWTVQATSAPAIAPVEPRADPLVALVRAVQRIPEDAWQEGSARVEQSLLLPDVSLPSIDVTPLDTPPLGGQVAEPLAPGEP